VERDLWKATFSVDSQAYFNPDERLPQNCRFRQGRPSFTVELLEETPSQIELAIRLLIKLGSEAN
jgi:hypothetical protein